MNGDGINQPLGFFCSPASGPCSGRRFFDSLKRGIPRSNTVPDREISDNAVPVLK